MGGHIYTARQIIIMLYRPRKFTARTLRDFQMTGQHLPNFYNRIDKIRYTNLINMIIIDGKSQTGKSTLAKNICEKYDPNYITVFTIEELLSYLEKCKENEDTNQGRFIFFDEPELEVNRNEWWTDRNRVLTFILSSFGFLHNNIVMALPNIKGLSDIILTNISLRISVKADYDEFKKRIVRKAIIKKAIWSDMKNKFIWITTEIHTIPDIEKDMNYEQLKRHNFYDVQLPKWRSQINKNNDIKEFTKSPYFVRL